KITEWPDDARAAVGRQRHLLQLQATDRLIGRVIARLKAIGAYDDAMIVVTADHGVSFMAGEPVRGLSARNAHEIAWIPLFVKYPGQTAGVVDDRPTRSSDIVPTIADAIGADVPWKLDGSSLLDPAPSAPEPTLM